MTHDAVQHRPRAQRDRDAQYITKAIELSRRSAMNGDHPFGALVVVNGEIVAHSQNQSERTRDNAQHAELAAMLSAAKTLAVQSLDGATLYSSTEPCAMCAALMHWYDVKRLVYGCSGKAFRAFRSNKAFIPCRTVFAGMGTRIEVAGPLCEKDAVAVHAEYWPEYDEES
ncbi:MAG: nucleoside deaminase [Terricaulis sp.]